MAKRSKGGRHYTANRIQPWDVIIEYELGYFAGNVVKYLLRSAPGNPKQKHPTPEGTLEDLRKALHYCEQLVALQEARVSNGS
ncbi:MAG: DUF3310 domain-containing protein [Pirellulales bacterium]|nr:DUF3310 domain-containing protein [Pirellulales bacterium]